MPSEAMASRLSIVAALAAAIGAVGFAAEHSARPENQKFVSKRYGYEIVLPGRWKATYARTAWTGKFPLMDSGEVGFFEDSHEASS